MCKGLTLGKSRGGRAKIHLAREARQILFAPSKDLLLPSALEIPFAPILNYIGPLSELLVAPSPQLPPEVYVYNVHPRKETCCSHFHK